MFRKKLTHPDTWGCTEDYNNMVDSSDEPIHFFKAHELQQYFSLIPAIKQDLIVIKSLIENADSEFNDRQKDLLKTIYRHVQDAGNTHSPEAFLKWAKYFVTKHLYANVSSIKEGLNIKSAFEKIFPNLNNWFDNCVVKNYENVARTNFNLSK